MTRIFTGLWNFITLLKNSIGNLIFIAIVVLIVVGIFSSEGESVPSSAALILNPTGNIVDQKHIEDPFNEFLSNYEDEDSETLLRDVLLAIDTAATDDRIKAMVLGLNKLNGISMSKAEELGAAIDQFKLSGKPVYAFGTNYSQKQYLIAAHADKIFLDKNSFQALGGVFFTGLGVYPTFFKSAIDSLKIDFHIFKVGLYKGFVEPYMRDNMSDAAREANNGWLGVLWDHYRGSVTAQRNLSAEAFDQYSNQYDQQLASAGNDSAQLAVKEGLVDELLSRQEWRNMMQGVAGKDGDSYQHVTLHKYLKDIKPPITPVNPSTDKVAVITAVGTIYDGNQPPGDIGSESMTKLIRKAREDKMVKALVIRVDSPGGSASAAELIRSELALTQKVGKPVTISMSGYAASGGYWISSTADKIFAEKTTITGSIGTFIIFPTAERSFAELGIHSDGVGTTKLSNAFNLLQPINPVLERSLQQGIQHTYQRFIGLVAQGRNMTTAEVDKIAQGRVWAGSTAVELGLVDSIGNLDDAITAAAELANVSDYDVLYLEKELTTKERVLKQIMNSSLRMVHATTGGFSSHWSILSRVPKEIDEFIQMSLNPGVYVQCVDCNVE